MRKKVGHRAFIAGLGLTLLFVVGVVLSLLFGSNAHPVLDVAAAAASLGFVWLLPILVVLALLADRTHPGKVTACALLLGLWLVVIAAGWWVVG